MRTSTNTVGLLLVEVTLGGSGPSDLSEWLVKQRVAQTVSLVTSAVHRHNGIVATRFGNALLCTFPKAPGSVQAAQDIMIAVLGSDGEGSQTGSRRQVGLKLVINYGKLTVVAGNISGEVVDVVGSLAANSEPNTIVATQALIDALPDATGWADLGERTVEGAQRGIRVYQLASIQAASPSSHAPQPGVSQPNARTSFKIDTPQQEVPVAPVTTDAEPKAVILEYEGQRVSVDAGNPTVRLGRSKENDLVILVSHASRQHAQVEHRSDGFHLINNSVNGSTVVTDAGEVLVGAGEMLKLTGSGRIALAPSAAMAQHAPISYEVV